MTSLRDKIKELKKNPTFNIAKDRQWGLPDQKYIASMSFTIGPRAAVLFDSVEEAIDWCYSETKERIRSECDRLEKEAHK